MARDGVAVDSRLAAAVGARVEAAKLGGRRLNVAAVCRELGISRPTFYKYVARFDAEGVEGFFPRSRRPLRSPAAVSAATADAIVLARKELAEEGGDSGAISIGWRLEDQGMVGVPSRATIHRVLVARGQVVAQPRKRPRSSAYRRFEAPFPNAMWQLDGCEVPLAEGIAVVLQFCDDKSRLNLENRAAASENGQDAWAAFQIAAGRYGLPSVLLTDNGSAFNGKRRGYTTDLETRVRALGVKPVCSSVGHPQTCGKNERGHATLLRWLAKQPPPTDLAELQALLDIYRPWYNNRRNQALGGLTPQQAWDLADKARPDGTPIPASPQITVRTVSPRGSVGVEDCEVGLGRKYRGAQATVFRTGDHVTIFIGAAHLRTLELDRTRRYQPLGVT